MARALPLFPLLLAFTLSPIVTTGQMKMSSPPPAVTTDTTQRSEGTKKMVEYLRTIAETFNVTENIMANTRRVEVFSQRENRTTAQKLELYQEMIFAGMTEQAITGLQELNARTDLEPGVNRTIEKMLGIAYLRLGEQENCVMNHTSQSCLVPIQPGGFHQLQRGSRSAIDIYSKLLREDSTDVKSRWLLNIAYMTLGEYPSKVPPQWLYPEEIFKSDYPLPHFNDIAPALGLDVSKLSGGASLEDFDNDGDIDIMTSSWGTTDQVLYYRNNGDGTFSDATEQLGLKGITGGLNMFDADYNNDGFVDVFITRGAWMGLFGKQPSSLLRNNGDGTFSDVTIETGLLHYRPTEAAAWGDFNNDGWLDLFVGNETTFESTPCELYMNNGNGTFTNIAKETGMDMTGTVKAVSWGDYDNDGLIDIYISMLGMPNMLMKNNGKKNGKWSFTNVAKQTGVELPVFSFPTFFFDYDNDGWLDLFVSDFGGRPSGAINGLPAAMEVIQPVVADYLKQPHMIPVTKLYHNNHNGTFTDVAGQMHIDKSLFGMGCNFGDLDNDGFLDIYVGTGHPDLDALIPNRMFRNADGKVFQDVTTSGGFGHLQKGHAISWADIDNDGDQDIFAEMGGAFEGDLARMTLFQNPGNGNHWTTLMLEGVKANKMATGARIKVIVQRADGSMRDIYSTVNTGGSFGSSSLQQEIGLGDAVHIEAIMIDWPGSHTMQTIKSPEMDCTLKIREGSPTIAKVERHQITMPSPNAQAGHHMHNMEHMDHMPMQHSGQ